MSTKLFSLGVAILVSLIPIKSVNANPTSCKASATTVSERKSVIILEDMYALQAQMNVIDDNLDELNSKQSLGYDSYDANSVNKYNDLINDYNDVLDKKNILSYKFNSLRDSFNAIISKTPPSPNILFVNCLNIAVMGIDINTSGLNLNSSTLDIKSMNVETENMMRNLNNLNY